jgi:hypothetical protein
LFNDTYHNDTCPNYINIKTLGLIILGIMTYDDLTTLYIKTIGLRTLSIMTHRLTTLNLKNVVLMTLTLST